MNIFWIVQKSWRTPNKLRKFKLIFNMDFRDVSFVTSFSDLLQKGRIIAVDLIQEVGKTHRLFGEGRNHLHFLLYLRFSLGRSSNSFSLESWRGGQTVQFTLLFWHLRLLNLYFLALRGRFRNLFWSFRLFSFEDVGPPFFVPVTLWLVFGEDHFCWFFFFALQTIKHWTDKSLLLHFIRCIFGLGFLYNSGLSFYRFRGDNRSWRRFLFWSVFYFEGDLAEMADHNLVFGLCF